MMIVQLFGGNGGKAGALVVTSNHVFESVSARSSYFSSHPLELKDNTYAIVGTSLSRYSTVDLAWSNITAVIQGPRGLQGADGKSVEFRVDSGAVQYRVVGDTTWLNLYHLSDTKGNDGKSVEMRRGTTHIQYRLIGDSTWVDILPLAELRGADGNGTVVPTSVLPTTGVEGVIYILTTDMSSHAWVGDRFEPLTSGQSGGSSQPQSIEVSSLRSLRLLDDSAMKVGTEAQVSSVGSFKYVIDPALISDGRSSLRSFSGRGKWVLSNPYYADYEWGTAGTKSGAISNAPTISMTDFKTGRMTSLSHQLPHSNILTRPGMEGRNKVIHIDFDMEKQYVGTSQNVFLRANKHNTDGEDYASLLVSTKVGSGTAPYQLNASICKGSTPTETVIASDTAALTSVSIFDAQNSDLLDSLQLSVKSFEGRVHVEMYSKRRMSKIRSIVVDNAEFAAMVGELNGFCLGGSTGGMPSYYNEIFDRTIENGSDYKNVVCLGDSQTYAAYHPGALGWVNHLSYLKRRDPVSFYNAGVSSDTIELASARIGTDVTPRFIAGADNICVIHLGTNDFYKGANGLTVIGRLDGLVATLKGLGWKVAVMTLTSLFQPYVYEWNEVAVNGYIDKVNNWILGNESIDFKIDLASRMRDPVTGRSKRSLVRTADGVHYTSSAQRIIASLVLKSLGID
jgi:lysophospholipase L1-like esterase